MFVNVVQRAVGRQSKEFIRLSSRENPLGFVISRNKSFVCNQPHSIVLSNNLVSAGEAGRVWCQCWQMTEDTALAGICVDQLSRASGANLYTASGSASCTAPHCTAGQGRLAAPSPPP